MPPPFTATRELPPYTGILAVDAKGFTGEPGSAHERISQVIPSLARDAFYESGIREAWDAPEFFNGTGDGFAIGVPTRLLPALVHPFLATLQQTLAAHNRILRRGEALLRLRVSLHVGPLASDPRQPHLTGNGTARNDTHRLLDSDAVRLILAASSPAVTHVAAVLSERVFQDVVLDGYTGRHPDHFIEVVATVPGKAFTQRAWLYVPEPSGSLLTLPRLSPPQPDPGDPASATPTPSDAKDPRPDAGDNGGVRIRNNSGQVARQVSGGMHQSRRDNAR